jgi:hypothetical protein
MHGEGPRPRSQGRFGIAGIRTQTGSDVCSVVANCTTPAPTIDYFILSAIEEVYGDDTDSTTLILKIHDMAKAFQAKRCDAFDGKAIAKAWRLLNWQH